MVTSGFKRKLRFVCVAVALGVILLFAGELLLCRGVYVDPCAPFIQLSREEYLWLWDEAPRQYSKQAEDALGLLNVFVSEGVCCAAVLSAWPLVYRKKALLCVPLWGKVLFPAAVAAGYAAFYCYVTYCVTRYPLYIDMFLPALCAVAHLGFWGLDKRARRDGSFVSPCGKGEEML